MIQTKIVFHDGNLHYYPGSNVRGSIIVTAEQPVECKKVTVRFLGEADVEWEMNTYYEQHKYLNSETYFKETIVVWGEENATSGELPAGEHNFIFEYKLPEKLPPSFESKFGNIKYEIKAEVHRTGMLKFNTVERATFYVREDPNIMQLSMEPKMVDMTEIIDFCCCFSYGSVSLTCDLPRTGYTLGDSIPLSFNIENHTTGTLYVTAVLFRSDHFEETYGGWKDVNDELTTMRSPDIQAGEVTTFESEELKIPADISSTIRGCSCITVEYSIVLRVNSDTMGSCPNKSIPIIVASKS